MGNIYTGSNSGKAGLNVKKTDDTVDVFGVNQIQLDTNLSLTNNGNGSVTIQSTGGGGGGSGVTELSFGTTGLTPAGATTGSITVAGTLEVGSGGTGLNSLGSANEFLKVDSGATALEYSDGLTYVSTAGSRQLKIVDSSADAMLVLESTASGATNAPDLKLFRNKSPPNPDDVLGQIKFTALEGNTATEVDYARIEARVDNGGLTTYGGSLDFYITNDAAEVRMLTISGEIAGTPNMLFDVNPDGDPDGDFRHLGNGGTQANIFSDAAARQLEIVTIRKYNNVTPAAGKVMIGDGNFLSLGDLTSTGGTITIDTATSPGDINLDVDSSIIPSGSGATNQVTYWDGANSIAGDNDFVFDSVNKRVGIGLTAPDVDLEIRATDDDKAELRISRNATQYTEIMNEDAQGGFIFNVSPQSNKKPLRIDAVHNNTGVAAGVLYIDLRLGQSQESGGSPAVYFRVTEEGLNSEPEVVVNESSNSVNFRVETNANTQAFFMDGSADTATFNVPVEINQDSNASGEWGLQLVEDTADANRSPDFFLYKDTATPTDGDDIGTIEWYGNNAASSGGAKVAKHIYGKITMDMIDVIASQESGRMFLNILKDGVERQGISIRGDGAGSVVIGDGNVGLGADGMDFRVETTSQNSAFEIDTSADTATFNIPLTINDYTLPTADGANGEVITTDGNGNLSFAAGGSPGGATTQIQFNNAGAFGGNSALTFNTTTTPPTLTAGSPLLNAPTQFRQASGDQLPIAPFTQTPGGNITSSQQEISLGFDAGFSALHEQHGLELKPTDYQVKIGKTTSQSFGQTQNTITGLGGGAQVVDCYPSQGGLIVVIGSATAITVNLVLGQEPPPLTGLGGFLSDSFPPQPPVGTAPTNTSNLPGYGTWQIGDQVTVLANLDLGETPNIVVRSYNSIQDGSLGVPSTEATAVPTDATATATKINGVLSDSTTSPAGVKTLTTNYTALTFILCQDQSTNLGVAWVCIG